MLISLINMTQIADGEVAKVVRAINRQIRDDFEPYWHWSGELRLEGCSPLNDSSLGVQIADLKEAPQDVRGDAILYLWDKMADVQNALGYHDENNRGLPYGFVFTEVSKQLNEPWSVTLSHETLELIGDCNVNTLAAGPHPQEKQRLVFHWYEMCDAVQAETYPIDGIDVSNFVLPLYFTIGEQTGARNDFLNRAPGGKGLRSFGVNPGGYIGFYDPVKGEQDTFAADERAKQRLEIKSKLGLARRSRLYRELETKEGSPRLMAKPPSRTRASRTPRQ